MAIRNAKLGGTDWETGNIITKADINDTNNGMYDYAGPLGEVKMFALSMTGAVTKATLQSNNWAICDGTTPSDQGITGATIANTPDLQEKFIRMSNDETSGTTGGADTHNHQWHKQFTGGSGHRINTTNTGNGTGGTYDSSGNIVSIPSDPISVDLYTDENDNKPPFYEMAFFIKVK